MLMIFLIFQGARTEITCRSCQVGNVVFARELLLKFVTSESVTAFKEVDGQEAERSRAAGVGTPRLRRTSFTRERAPDGADASNLTRNTKTWRSNDGVGENISPYHGSGGAHRTRGRRSSERSRDDRSVDRPSPRSGTRVTRSELRWNGEERRGGGSRQDELKLNSSTFALTGDSSHNQAMVHWSGQNSSVSDFFCPRKAPQVITWLMLAIRRGTPLTPRYSSEDTTV